MKVLLVILGLTFSGLVYSQPYDMCQHKGQCSETQDKIYKKFQSCAGYNPEINSKRVYSGSCYHNSKLYSNEDAHYGAMYFDVISNKPRFGGSFAFYYASNPYSYLTNTQAQEKYSSSINKENHTLDISNRVYGHVFWDGTLPENTVEYWFKTCGDQIYLQGAWGPHHQFICELNPNE